MQKTTLSAGGEPFQVGKLYDYLSQLSLQLPVVGQNGMVY